MDRKFQQIAMQNDKVKKLSVFYNIAEELRDEVPKLYFYVTFLLLNKLRGELIRYR